MIQFRAYATTMFDGIFDRLAAFVWRHSNAINRTSVPARNSDEACTLRTYRLTSTVTGSESSRAQKNFLWRLSRGRVYASTVRATTVPQLASLSAMSRQRVATFRCDIDDSPSRCIDPCELDPELFAVHEHVFSTNRAEGRDREFALVFSDLRVTHPIEPHTILGNGRGIGIRHT